MIYVTKQYYARHGRHKGDDVAELLARAHDLVEHLTYGQIGVVGFARLTKFQQRQVRKAICLMVNHFANVDNLPAHNISSYSANGMRVHQRVAKEKPWEVAECGPWAWTALMATGLMRRTM